MGLARVNEKTPMPKTNGFFSKLIKVSVEVPSNIKQQAGEPCRKYRVELVFSLQPEGVIKHSCCMISSQESLTGAVISQ